MNDYHDERDEFGFRFFWIGLRYTVDWQYVDGSKATEDSVHWAYPDGEPDAVTSSQYSCALLRSDADNYLDLLTHYNICAYVAVDYYGICEFYRC